MHNMDWNKEADEIILEYVDDDLEIDDKSDARPSISEKEYRKFQLKSQKAMTNLRSPNEDNAQFKGGSVIAKDLKRKDIIIGQLSPLDNKVSTTHKKNSYMQVGNNTEAKLGIGDVGRNPSSSRLTSTKSPGLLPLKSYDDVVDMSDNLKLTDYRKKARPRPETVEKFSNAAGTSHDTNCHSSFNLFTNSSYKAFQNAMLDIIIEKDLQNFLDLEDFFEYYLQISTPSYQDLVKEFFKHFCDGLLWPEESVTDISSDRLNVSDSFSIQVSEAFMADFNN